GSSLTVAIIVLLAGGLAMASGGTQEGTLAAGRHTIGAPRTSVTKANPVQGPRGAFGFQVGEERRYILDPPESLRSGESASWRIRLDRLQGEDLDRQAVFVLEHQRDELLVDFLSGGRLLSVRVDAEVTVNGSGFPLKLVLNEQRDVGGARGSRSDLRTTTYLYQDGRYLKRVRFGGREWKFDVPIASNSHLDLEAQSGLYLYLPSGLGCMGRLSDMRPSQPMRRRSNCDFSDPAFANPGLLSLVLPQLREQARGELEVLFFTPIGVGTRAAGLIDMRRWLSRERGSLRNLDRYYDPSKLKLAEPAEVQVGGRTMDAWRLDVGGSVRDVFVDSAGRVLRENIDPDPTTFAKRWIRLLFASEY
ncbi:MAG: hypothetical protein ACE5HV_14465, partial [Acidobacteriota bacterium]